MQLPDGSEENFDFIKHKGAAAVIPVMDDGRIIMVRQYRNAIDSYTLEIPAGGLNGADEPTKIAAHRELEEETGYFAKMEDVEFLLTLYTTVAFCNEKIGLYLARGLKDRHPQHLDDDEYIDLEAVSLDDALKMIYDGKIQDAKTVIGILMYASKYRA